MENDLHVKYFSMFAVKYFTCKIFFNGGGGGEIAVVVR
jgi:hypothetical protein